MLSTSVFCKKFHEGLISTRFRRLPLTGPVLGVQLLQQQQPRPAPCDSLSRSCFPPGVPPPSAGRRSLINRQFYCVAMFHKETRRSANAAWQRHPMDAPKSWQRVSPSNAVWWWWPAPSVASGVLLQKSHPFKEDAAPDGSWRQRRGCAEEKESLQTLCKFSLSSTFSALNLDSRFLRESRRCNCQVAAFTVSCFSCQSWYSDHFAPCDPMNFPERTSSDDVWKDTLCSTVLTRSLFVFHPKQRLVIWSLKANKAHEFAS